MKLIIAILISTFFLSCADLRTQAHWNNQVEDGETKVTVKRTVRGPSGNQWDQDEGEVIINKKSKIKSYGFSIGNK